MLGITNATQFSAATADMIQVPGTTNLYTGGPGMPEGMLFKRIRNLDDAVACGGLLILDDTGMRNAHAGTQWVFYVGDTLKQAMSAELLGYMSVTTGNPSFTQIPLLTNKATYVYTTTEGASLAGVEESTHTATGYAVNRVYGDRYVFLTYTTLNLWGIVTTASRGMGSKRVRTATVNGSIATTDNYGFMASDTPMSVTMTQFLLNHKTAFLNTIDEDVRGFYASAYDAAAANRLRKPTLAAVTAWRNGDLCPIPMHGDYIVHKEKAQVDGTFYVDLLNPVRVAAATARGGYSPTVTTPDSGPTSGGNNYPETPFHLKGAIGRRMGSSSFPALLQPETYFATVVPTVAAATGAVGAYKVGMLRDSHLLGRLSTGAPSLTVGPEIHPNLASYINSAYMTMRSSPVSNLASADTELEVEAAFTAMNSQNASDYSNAFTYGEIVGEIEHFVATWDSMAKAYAQA